MGTRINWLDDDFALEEKVAKLQHFMDSMADGQIDKDELATQNEAVVSAMKAVQNELDDATHAKVTDLLVEVAALSIMSTLHELAASRLRRTFGE
jgi:hypothetical protein